MNILEKIEMYMNGGLISEQSMSNAQRKWFPYFTEHLGLRQVPSPDSKYIVFQNVDRTHEYYFVSKRGVIRNGYGLGQPEDLKHVNIDKEDNVTKNVTKNSESYFRDN